MISRERRSLLCIGLDPQPPLPASRDPLSFNLEIIKATEDLVCAYKLNLAFYESLGTEGLEILLRTRKAVPSGIPVIGDGKRGDVPHSAGFYAKALFEIFDFDAVTVNPLFGFDGIKPFLEYPERGVFVLCRSSNKTASDFQDRGSPPLFELIALKAREWNEKGNIGLVVGAQSPHILRRLRALCPEMFFLIPGIGAQGGRIEDVLPAASRPHPRLIIAISRSIIFASSGPDFPSAARKKAQEYRDKINSLLPL